MVLQKQREHIWENRQIIPAAKLILRIQLMRCRLRHCIPDLGRQVLLSQTYGPFQMFYCIHCCWKTLIYRYHRICLQLYSFHFAVWTMNKSPWNLGATLPHDISPSVALSEAQIKTRLCLSINFPGYWKWLCLHLAPCGSQMLQVAISNGWKAELSNRKLFFPLEAIQDLGYPVRLPDTEVNMQFVPKIILCKPLLSGTQMEN